MKRVAVFTSGNDAPGMNACIRAVVRTSLYVGLEPLGIRRGYHGMIDGDIVELKEGSVSNILQKGGTILKCGKSELFKSKTFRRKAFHNLKKHKIDALVAIGGKGTFKGAKKLYHEFGMPVLGIPGTIDNDLVGTDYTIGYDTAVNTALTAIDQLRDTANSHERIFVVEVMGRDSGHIAVKTAIAGGAEMTLFPERKISLDEIIYTLKDSSKGKSSQIIVVGEDSEVNRTEFIGKKIKEAIPELDLRITTLGYIQRGGQPSAADRILASQLGIAAVEGLMKGKSNAMVGIVNRSVCFTPFSEVINKQKTLSDEVLRMITVLNTERN